MTTTQGNSPQVADFRGRVEQRVNEGGRFGNPVWSDREDGSTLTTRWPLTEDLYLEVTIRPLLPQVRVGIVTDDRWKSEEIEQSVQDSGDNMAEFLEVALAEVGLDWEDPPVEHYRHEGRWFSFITPIELQSLDDLATRELKDRVTHLIEGYANSYGTL